MVITFFSGIFLTAGQVFQALYMPIYLNPNGAFGGDFSIALPLMTPAKWAAFAVITLLTALFTPVLSVSCNHYFVKRLQNEELGTAGLWCRISCFGKALWLYVMMGVRVLLWGLLLVVPGIIAAIRYSLAPYYLAENPDMTPSEAIEASKAAMQDQKMNYFMLMLSFIGWALLSDAVQLGLMSLSGTIATVAGLFFQVWIGAYTNAAVASFYLTFRDDQGVERARQEMRSIAREIGMDATPWDEPAKRPDREDDGTQGGAAENEDADSDGAADVNAAAASEEKPDDAQAAHAADKAEAAAPSAASAPEGGGETDPRSTKGGGAP